MDLEEGMAMVKQTFEIGGMSCAACAASVEKVTSKLAGVQASSVNLLTNQMTIEYDQQQVTAEQIAARVQKAGFSAKLQRAADETQQTVAAQQGASPRQAGSVVAALVMAALLLAFAMGPMLIPGLPLPGILRADTHPVNAAIVQMLLAGGILMLGRRFFISGIKALIARAPTMDSLVALGSGSAYAYSVVLTLLISDAPHHVHHLYFESAGIVVALVMLGKYLEERSKQKTTGAIRKLMQLAPDTALVEQPDGSLHEIPSARVQPGAILLVRPGQRIALDGVVLTGESSVDESMLTGEAAPVPKRADSAVIGGSLNHDGALRMRVTRTGKDTVLEQIVRFMQEAQSKKAPISRLADQVSRVFVPVVLVIAVLSGIVWAALGKDMAFVMNVVMAILVIACPCAMGLATPTALMVGMGVGAQHGILIRNGEALEVAHRVHTVLLDKTGTVTRAQMAVASVQAAPGRTEEEIIALAAGLEAASSHPLASALVQEAKRRGLMVSAAGLHSVKNHPGMGMTAQMEKGEDIAVGNQPLMQQLGIEVAAFAAAAQQAQQRGETTVFIALAGQAAGLIGVADQIREGAAQAVAALNQLDIETVMLTGDRKAAAHHVAAAVGIGQVVSEVLPGDKAQVVERYKGQGKTVMMVGDGINDGPALVAADVGCAIGSGSDIALESADIVLMKSDPMDVVRAVRLSKATIRNIKQNLFWAFFYNILGIPVAAGLLYALGGPLMNPMLAGLAMAFSSVFVVTNALRLRRIKL